MDSKGKWERVDPALRGGQPPFAHRLDSWQMEAVAAICDTFVPALPMKALEHDDESASIARFYRTSASDAGIPEEVAGLIVKCLDPQVARTVEWTLWLLATRIGTLLLCGKAALCGAFPYVQRFAALPVENRERALVSWSTGSVRRMQSLFKLFKCYCLWAFYSKADENGRNDAVWDAIGYPAPDPSWNGLSSPCSKNAEEIPPPLPVFDIEQANSASSGELVKLLSAAGCSVRVLEQQEKALAAAAAATEELLPDVAIDCDVVVAGSGCGGGVLAAALAAKGHKVVVLDKGKYFAGQQLSLLEGPSMKAMYENAGMLATLDGGINFLAASTVGGGSAINWAASFRSPQNVLDEWHGLGLELFSSDEYRSAMDRVCERLGVQVHTRNEHRESFQNAVLRKGCERMGYHVESIPRNCKGEEHACGMCGLGCKSRQKQGTTETWLMDAVAAGAVILSGCRAERVVLHREEELEEEEFKVESSKKKPWRARGVVASSSSGSGRRFLIRAKATVSACGSLHTPVLLRRSGLSNRHLGSNLHVHPTQMVWGYFPQGEEAEEGRVFEGPIMSAISKEVAESFGAVLEVPALPPGTFAGMTPWQSGAEFKDRMLGYSRTAHVIVIVRDSGSGTVRESNATGAAPGGGKVLPSVCYRLTPEDEEKLKEGADRALRVLIAAGAEEVGTQHPDCERLRVGGVRDESEIEEFLRRVRARGLTSAAMSIGTAHQMGSCRMGVDAEVSAVDPRGETWESSGLFVADASVFPTALGINPMITVQSVALCIANSVHCYLKNSY